MESERYSFTLSDEEAAQAAENYMTPFYKVGIGFAIVSAMLFFVSISSSSVSMLSFAIVFTLSTLAVFLYTYFKVKRSWKAAHERLSRTRHEYEISDGRIKVEIFTDEKKTDEHIAEFNEIVKITELGKVLLIQASNIVFILKSSAMGESPAIREYIKSNPTKYSRSAKDSLHKLISGALCVASVLSLISSLMMANTAAWWFSVKYNAMLWVAFCFTPVPIGALAYAGFSKKNGRKYKTVLGFGIASLIALIAIGTLAFIL